MEQNTKIILGFIGIVFVVIISLILYISSEIKRKKKIKRDELDLQEKRRQIELKFKQEMIDLYGEDIGAKIYNRKFFLGMTTTQLIYAKRSEADKKEVTESKGKRKETWIFGNKSSGDIFVFEDGICVKITDR